MNDEDYISHHGVKGMKWGQHIFGKVNSGVSRVKARAKENLEKSNDPKIQRRAQIGGAVAGAVGIGAGRAYNKAKRINELRDPSGSDIDIIRGKKNLTNAPFWRIHLKEPVFDADGYVLPKGRNRFDGYQLATPTKDGYNYGPVRLQFKRFFEHANSDAPYRHGGNGSGTRLIKQLGGKMYTNLTDPNTGIASALAGARRFKAPNREGILGITKKLSAEDLTSAISSQRAKELFTGLKEVGNINLDDFLNAFH